MRLFDHFPKEHAICPICKTNEDKPCFLAGIDGTQDGNNEEATVIHFDCLKLRYKPKDEFLEYRGIIYQLLED